MSKFKAGDKVRVIKASGEWYWYAARIGEVFTILDTDGIKSYFVKERPGSTVKEDDIELVSFEAVPCSNIEEAVLSLQSLLPDYGSTEIVITNSEIFVKSLGHRTFLCENAEVLEEVCKAVSYLTRQELT